MTIRRTYPLFLLVCLLIGMIAVLAAVNLWYLQRLHSRSLHETATRSVLDLGAELVRTLASQPVVQSAKDDPSRWTEFGRLVRSLKGAEPSLHYVNVNEGNVTLYHEDTSVVTHDAPTGTKAGEVRVGRKILAAGRELVPVLTFTAVIPDVGGQERVVQIALRREAVQQREEQAGRLLEIMFRLSVITLTVALGLAGVFGVWVLRQEMERQRRRRDEEHLAFAGLLADGIIHDVRNPMSSLRLDIQLLEKEAGKGSEGRLERISELAARARNTMDRVDLVMREFLYVSRPGARDPERFDVNACVQDCVTLLGPRFESADVILECRLDPGPLEVTGQAVAVKRAVINVLTNAKQVSTTGGRVTLTTRRDGHQAVLDIEDEGPGIQESHRTRIFEMFVTGRPDGTGLGLYLARAAVENSGGTIAAANRPQGGARFTIRLPLAA
ncbi:MAG: HAMP domain-containing sensor histidine kinase [bacterium]